MNKTCTLGWLKEEQAVPRAGAVKRIQCTAGRRISWYVKKGQNLQALDLYQQIQKEGTRLDKATYIQVLKACSNLSAFEKGKRVHADMIRIGYLSDICLSSYLITMYANCGSITDAIAVFRNMSTHDVVSWSAMIMGLVKCGLSERALQFFKKMKLEGVKPNSITFVGVLNACASVVNLEEGRHIHAELTQCGYRPDVFLGTSLIDMYAKCDSIEDACHVFNSIVEKNVCCWNSMIGGYAKCEHATKALALFQQMQRDHHELSNVTFVAVINACASLEALDAGRRIHRLVLKSKLKLNIFIGSSLVDMYAKCGSIDDACRVFNNMPEQHIITWSSMIAGYEKCGDAKKALNLYRKMISEHLEPNGITFLSIFNACADIEALEEARHAHAHMIVIGCNADASTGNSLIDMYMKCGSTEDACRMFNSMRNRDVVSWNVMIAGYSRERQAQKALELFRQMKREQLEPDSFTFVALLSACSSAGALEEGKLAHTYLIGSRLEKDINVGCSLINMYAKCGCITEARKVFNNMPTHNALLWNFMIMGYAAHGFGKEALLLLEEMNLEDAALDHGTFTGILSACSHAGLVDEGQYYLEAITPIYGVVSMVEHFSCVIDLLGRAGFLTDARHMIDCMPFQPNVSAWMALLGACRLYGNLEVAEFAAERVLELDPGNSASYVLLSNMYAAAAAAVGK